MLGSCANASANPAHHRPPIYPPRSNVTASIVVGFETSCDETGIGIVAGTKILAHQVVSSMDQHVAFGGVVQENSARVHVNVLWPLLDVARHQTDINQ